ncbi:MAG: rod shape-determining protein MreC [Dehalococcoidia bacterium]
MGLISIVLSQQRALDPVENLYLRITSPLDRGLQGLAEPMADFFEGVFDRGELVRENRRLSEENLRLQSDLANLQDTEQRYQELIALLEVKEGRPEDQFAVANVIARDTGNLKRAIAIDRGTNDDVVDGMAVIAEGGSLVGTVSRAYDDFAWISLVTDPDSVVNALVQKADASGVVNGDLRRGLMLDLVPSSASLKPGLLVTTSGLGGSYPRGLFIGTIESVDSKPQALFQKAILTPASDLSDLETMLVLTSFTPARLEEP